MRIWHQSFTVLDDVPHYRDALARHLRPGRAPGTKIDLHGMRPGTYPSDYPGTHIGYAYLAGLHKEQFVQAALQRPGRGVRRVPHRHHPGHRLTRRSARSSTSRWSTFGQTSVLIGRRTLGDCVGIVNFIAALEPQLRRNLRNYRLDGLVGPIVQVDAEFTDVMAAYDRPGPLLEAFTVAARRAIAAGANVIVPGEGPLNVFLADQGVSRVDDVRCSTRSAPASGSPSCGPAVPRDRPASRRGPASTSAAAAALVDAARAFYGVTDASAPGMRPRWRPSRWTSRSLVGAGACGVMTALRAVGEPRPASSRCSRRDPRGLQRRDLQRQPRRGGTRFQRAAGIDDSPQQHAARHPGRQRRRGVAARRRGALRGRAGVRASGSPTSSATPRDRRRPAARRACPCRGCTRTSAGWVAGRLMSHLRRGTRPTGRTSPSSTRHRSPASGAERRSWACGSRQGGHDLSGAGRTTMLARDGFAGNRALMQALCPALGDPFHGGVSTRTGDAMAGSSRSASSCATWEPACGHGQVAAARHACQPGAALARRRAGQPTGRRFVDEEAHGYSALAGSSRPSPGERAVMVWDDEAHAAARTPR